MQRFECSKRDNIGKTDLVRVNTIHFTVETELSMRFRAKNRWRSWRKSSWLKGGLNQNIVVFTAKIQQYEPQTVTKMM